jgi:hypothetical protein
LKRSDKGFPANVILCPLATPIFGVPCTVQTKKLKTADRLPFPQVVVGGPYKEKGQKKGLSWRESGPVFAPAQHSGARRPQVNIKPTSETTATCPKIQTL